MIVDYTFQVDFELPSHQFHDVFRDSAIGYCNLLYLKLDCNFWSGLVSQYFDQYLRQFDVSQFVGLHNLRSIYESNLSNFTIVTYIITQLHSSSFRILLKFFVWFHIANDIDQ